MVVRTWLGSDDNATAPVADGDVDAPGRGELSEFHALIP
jgi:hypothetical protein